MISGSLALWQHVYWKGRKGRKDRSKIFSLCESELNYTWAYGYKDLSLK